MNEKDKKNEEENRDAFSLELKDHELIRKEDGLYTLGDPNLDRLYGLNMQNPSFVPSQNTIREFAYTNIMLGLAGYVVKNYTVDPVGILATYSNGDKTETIHIPGGSFNNTYMCTKLQEVVDRNLDDSLTTVAASVAFLLDSCPDLEDVTIHANDICLDVEDPRAPFGNIIMAMAPFRADVFSVSQENRLENMKLLRRVSAEILGLDIDKLSDDELFDVNEKTGEILGEFIIPTEQIYDGEVCERNINILSDPATIKKLVKMVSNGKDDRENLKRVNTILNICANDCVSSSIYMIMKAYIFNGNEKIAGEIKKVAPSTPYAGSSNLFASDYVKKAASLARQNLDDVEESEK